MYYHVILDLDDKFYKRRPEQVEIKSDLIDLNEIKAKYIESYEIGNPILMNGRTIPVDHIKRLRIPYESSRSTFLFRKSFVKKPSLCL